LLDLLSSHPINNGIKGCRDDMVKDIEQDWHIRRDRPLGHMCKDKDKKDGAKEEDKDEVGATGAQSFSHSTLCLKSQHSSQYEGVGDEDENKVRSQQSPASSKLVKAIDSDIIARKPGDRHIGTDAILNDISPTVMELC
jgi:hypothetical protein